MFVRKGRWAVGASCCTAPSKLRQKNSASPVMQLLSSFNFSQTLETVVAELSLRNSAVKLGHEGQPTTTLHIRSSHLCI